MKHAVLLAILLVGAFLGWRVATPEQRIYAAGVARRYVVPALLIIAIVAVFFALFVINSPIQIL